MKKKLLFATLFCLGIVFSGLSQNSSVSNLNIGQKDKVLHMSANLVVDTPEILFERIDRAKAAGANTVLFSDSKLNTYGLNGTFDKTWDERMNILVDGIRERGMKLNFITISMGFASSLIASNPNLTTGYPIENQELKAINGALVPVTSANIINGGFENFDGNKVISWRFQDAIGERTFIDTNIKRSGEASLRAEARNNLDSRIFNTFDVTPFHQYILRCWIKTENLTARNFSVLLRDKDNLERTLTNLHISERNEKNGGRKYIKSPNKLNTNGWEEVRIAFNSLNATTVDLGLAVFGGVEGTIWWDDVQVIDAPALNWINRDDLPTSIKHSNGQNLSFGSDVALPKDDLLGTSGFSGAFDTHHTPPTILINNTSKIKEGDIVEISGYHALPTASGQISASWNNPEIYERMRKVHQTLYNDFRPDGFLLNYSEIRTGGWEPSDIALGTSGAALAKSIEQSFNDLFDVAPDANYYFWSDMVDPEHNAIADYYQINNTLDKSWVTLDPKKITLATWWEGQKIIDRGTNSLKFFSNLGFKQIVGAFYDADVDLNFNQWQTASQGTDDIIGSIYATWVTPKDFSKLEEFGSLWWQGEDTSIDITGNYWRLENKATGQWVRPLDCSSDLRTELVVSPKANDGNCTMFQFVNTTEGHYFIINKATKGRIKFKNDSSLADDTVPVILADDTFNGWNPQWKLINAGDGYYRIQNRVTGNWIRSQNCSGDVNTPITQVSTGYNGDCTKWKLIDTGESTTKQNDIVNNEDIKLYPNPVSAELSLQISENSNAEIQSISIYDIQGRKHGNISLDTLSVNQNTIDVTGFANGLYILSIDYDKKQTQNIRFIIKH